MIEKLKNTHKRLIELGFNIEVVNKDTLRFKDSLVEKGMTLYDLWTIIKEFGTTMGWFCNKDTDIDITEGYKAPKKVVDTFLGMEDYLEDSISKGFSKNK